MEVNIKGEILVFKDMQELEEYLDKFPDLKEFTYVIQK